MSEEEDEIARALRDTLISVNVPDDNFEAANIVDVINRLARSIDKLGDALVKVIAESQKP